MRACFSASPTSCCCPHQRACLYTQVCKPKDFAGQINLSMDHCWGIVRALVDMVMRLDDGKYLLVKDPMKELLRWVLCTHRCTHRTHVREGRDRL